MASDTRTRTSTSKHILPGEWERHRDRIVGLRRSGTILEGDDGIMAIMKREHGFVASSSQYELQLNKWAERKNLHAEEWRQIIQTVDQYNEDGIHCDVYRNGQLIPRWTLKRKRKEYCQGHDEPVSVKGVQGRVAASPLPEFIEFRTSPSATRPGGVAGFNPQNKDSDPSYGISTIAPSSIIEPCTDTTATALSVTDFGRSELVDLDSGTLVVASSPRPQEHIALAEASLATTHHTTQSLGSPFPWTIYSPSAEAFLPLELESRDSVYQQFPPFAEVEPAVEFLGTGLPFAKLSDVPAAEFSIPNKHSTLERSRSVPRNAIPLERDASPGKFFNVDLIDTWTSRIPFLQFEKHLQAQGISYLDGKSAACIQRPAHNRQMDHLALEYAGNESGLAFSTHARSASVPSDYSTPSGELTHTEIFNSALLSLLPPDASSSVFNHRTTMQNQPFQSSFHRSLIFSIANNFAGLDGVPMGAVLEYLAKDPHMHLQFMKYLRAGPKYVCKAIAENLIRAAIEKCDATLVTALLSTGLVTADGIVCLVKGSRCAAVQRSAMLRSIEVTRALLVAGANVKKAYGAWGGPLELAIRSGKKASPVDIELVNLLLEWGAEVRSTHLLFAAREKDDILFRSLMSKFSPLQCHEYLHAKKFEVKSFIDVAIGLLDCELATMAVTLMLQAHFQTGCGKCPQSSRILRRSISNAAMRGFSDLVILLLEYIPKTDLPLAPAVRSGQRDLIELLLEQGAAVDPAAYDLIGDMSPTSTPLAEAIRGGNNELVRDFENRGALSRIRERGRFDAAIYAAAEVNNIAYAQKLLQIAPDISGGALSPALEISIQKGHEDMALLLLRAGADVNVFSNKIGRGLYMDKGDAILLIALRQRNEVLARAVMGCGMEVNVSMHGRPFDSPLLLAVRWGNLGIIRDLLSMGAVVDEDGEIDGVLDRRVNTDDDDDDHRIHCTYQDPRDFRETAVTAAVKGSNKLLVELLVNKYQASLNLFSDRETSPLAAAISNKDTDMLRYLLELGADPACHSAFRKAISGGGELFSELLCAFRAKYPMGKPGFGGVPLSIAIRRNDEQGLDALLEAKFDVNAFAFMGNWMLNSLGTAIREHGRRNLSIIRKLIRAGSDVNEIVARNMPAALLSLRTALLEAISTKNKALVELLVEAGADTNRPAQLGIKRTPLQHACEVGSLEIAEFLLDRGADVNEEPAFRGGATSLQLCTMAGYAGIADKLLKSGADVHAPRPESKGRTALEGAAEHGRLDMLRILWDATAGQGFDAEQIESAMKLAEGNGHLACRDLIQKLRLVGRALIMPEPFDF